MSLIISKLKLSDSGKLEIYKFPSKPFKFNKTTAWPEISILTSCLKSLSLCKTLKLNLFARVKLKPSFVTLTTWNYWKVCQIKAIFCHLFSFRELYKNFSNTSSQFFLSLFLSPLFIPPYIWGGGAKLFRSINDISVVEKRISYVNITRNTLELWYSVVLLLHIIH